MTLSPGSWHNRRRAPPGIRSHRCDSGVCGVRGVRGPAGRGPHWGAVGRLAVAPVLAAHDGFGADPATLAAVAGAIARGYADEITAIAAGADPPAMARGTDPYPDHLLAKAEDAGAAG